MSRCNFPIFTFGLTLPTFGFPTLPSLPFVTLAIPWPPFCPLD